MVDIITLYPGSPILSSGLNYNFDNLKTAVEGAGGGVQTYTIAASGALLYSKADFKCDGVADDVEINAAIGSLSPLGGAIRFTEGIFNISAPIVINKNGILLEGVSPSFASSTTASTLAFSGLNASGMCITTNAATLKDFTMKNIRANAMATGSAFFGNFEIDGFKLEDCKITTSGIPIFGTPSVGVGLDEFGIIKRCDFLTTYMSGLNKEYGHFENSDDLFIEKNNFDIRAAGSLLMPSGIRFEACSNIRIIKNNIFMGDSYIPYNVLDLTDTSLSHFWICNNFIYGAPGYRADTVATKTVEWAGRRSFFTNNVFLSESSGTSLYLNSSSQDTIATSNISALYARAVPLCNSGTNNIVANNLYDV